MTSPAFKERVLLQLKESKDFKAQVISQCNYFRYIKKQSITQVNEANIQINSELAKINNFSSPWQVFIGDRNECSKTLK
jgi:hypothetical protein